jgi:hypothetical protein
MQPFLSFHVYGLHNRERYPSNFSACVTGTSHGMHKNKSDAVWQDVTQEDENTCSFSTQIRWHLAHYVVRNEAVPMINKGRDLTRER